jgi:hypothetical protein
MKVEIEVCGFKVAAETDYRISPSLSAREQEVIGTAMFVRLCNEARAVAKDYIARMPIAAKEGGAK